ncbi:type II toxin-antitoxin system RelE/ParE family toxin [Photorhabdus tasmaniensis]|uniref:type II toxin-antitoxin system RelE/ParE family toxin n=1 Tax=Photorhabdus TaxID=29487 RepID=UPI0036DF9C7D
MTKVIITKVARLSLLNLEGFKARTVGIKRAQEIIDELIAESTKSISENPGMHHRNIEALARGLTLYEWIDPVNQYKVLYTYNGSQAVINMFCNTREDFSRLLYVIMIAH